MKEEMEQVFHHCLSVIRTEEGYYPVRFTEKQLAFYKGLGERFETRSLCTAGVTMEFTTSAKARVTISFFIVTERRISSSMYS